MRFAMTSMRTIALASVAVLFVCGQTQSADVIALQATQFSRPPNYAATTDANDLVDLTDGKIPEFPSWVRKESVGWEGLSPIAIELRLPGLSDARELASGVLQIHVPKGLRSGVDVPRQIDVYTRMRDRQLRLIGSVQPDSTAFANNSALWIDIPVSATTPTVVMVIHAGGDFLFVNEIAWRHTGTGSISRVSPDIVAADVDAALRLSSERLHHKLVDATRVMAAEKQNLGPEEIVTWVQDPWAAEIPRSIPNAVQRQRQTAISLHGHDREHEVACIGAAFGRTFLGSDVSVVINGISADSIKLSRLDTVLAANGKEAYDPLLPLEGPPFSLRAETGKLMYLWLDADLSKLTPGEHRFEVCLQPAASRAVCVPGTVRVVDWQSGVPHRLHAVNWGYFSDMPIFNDERAAVDLRAHGIDVFVVHPRDIPGVELAEKWSAPRASALTRTMQAAGSDGTLLLYLGWTAQRNPLGFSAGQGGLPRSAEEKFLRWVTDLQAWLAKEGFSTDRWALYPVDEPDVEGLALLEVVARTIKQHIPGVKIYANPSLVDSRLPSATRLAALSGMVDIWQPNLHVVRRGGTQFVRDSAQEWWLYGNPASPAKLGRPLADYRLLAWWAWYYNAKGVGFWSYSDTAGSSAWNDFDGRRPDWAVVYESDRGVVSSRRWEAFSQGLEDYALLAAHGSQVLQELRRKNVDFDTWQSVDVESIRGRLFNSSSGKDHDRNQ